MKLHEITVSAKLAQAAAVFIAVSTVSLSMLSRASPMAWEDHFQIGQNLRSTGSLTAANAPSIFRPPGFPGFVAASLWIGDAISGREDAPGQRSAERDQRVVTYAQGVLLGALAALLFHWASRWGGFTVAAAIAIAAALNPYSLAIANIASYHLLFVVLAIFSTLGLSLLRRPSLSSELGAGLLWGVTSLVKPVTLTIPVFIAPVLLFRRPLRTAVRAGGLLVIGMALIVGPYVVRNYLLTGHPFVTAQGGIGFWGSSVEQMSPDESYLTRQPIWWKYGMPIFSRVTGSAEYREPLLNVYALQLNDAFWDEAKKNIIAAPLIYLYNVLRNFISFNLDTMGFWNKFFVAHNKRLVQALSEFWIVIMMIQSAAGAVWGCIKKDDDALNVTAVYLCIVIAHSISFATELYAIAKLPLVILGFALLMKRFKSLPRSAALARVTACGMAGLGLVISVLAA